MHQLERHRQQGLEPDAARLGLGEGHALAVLVLRAVVRHDRVDHAAPQALDDRLAIGFSARSGGTSLPKVR